MWNFHSASWWNSFIKFNKRAVVAGCWTLCDLEEGEQSAGSVDPSSGIISSSHPTGRKGGRALPGCGQPRIPANRSGDFLAPSGSAAGSHRWHAAGRVAGTEPQGAARDMNAKKHSTGTLPFLQQKKLFLCGGDIAKIKHSARGNLPLGSHVK